ncbi:MAG: mevalonate kinase [Deltaproteobacteria bacterium]|nr:mevalonate kinase [Deltaproteobacteria bacterium]MCB9788822.1 mevalonate kinase [Deltaproteobacteria bacterium]
MTTGRAPGKVILAGEHFVVHGAPALAVPLASRGVEVEVERAPGAWDVPADVEQHLRRMLGQLEVDPQALTLRLSTDLPVGAGLGGSAAVAVALVRALWPEASDAEVCTRAHGLERLAHGNPSGIDGAVATFARPVWLVRGEAPEVLDGAPPPGLWVALSAERTATRDAIARVADFASARSARFAAMLTEARRLVTGSRAELLAADWGALGATMDRVHALLVEVGVSTPALDGLVNAARGAGALGAKLTGGGLGGAAIALAPAGLDLGPALRAAGATEVIAP